jgi:enoyl-CoA hydratase/carnithine racemase
VTELPSPFGPTGEAGLSPDPKGLPPAPLPRAERGAQPPAETLSLTIDDGVATITLDRPPVNAISMALLQELERCLQKVDRDVSARVLIITGAGDQTFSAGADFQEFASDSVRDFLQKGAAVFNLIEHFRKPVIAAINGGAYGGGFELVLACHLRFMADTAHLASTEVRLGITPGWGSTQRLPRLIGRTRALQYLLTGDRMNAQEAAISGLVNQVTTAAALLPETNEFARRLAKGAPLAMAAIIDAVARGLETTTEEGLRIEAAHALEVGQSEDAVIGIMSMAQGKQPEFRGS